MAIVTTHEVLRGNIRKKQVLIQWRDVNMEDRTWEDFEDFQKLYPAFQLEDKLVFQKGGHDMSLIRGLDQELAQQQAQQWVESLDKEFIHKTW